MITEKQFEEFIENLKEKLLNPNTKSKNFIEISDFNYWIDKLSKDIYSQGKKDNNEVQNDLLSGATKYEEGKTINTEHIPLNADNHPDTQKDLCECGHEKGEHWWDIPKNEPKNCDKCKCKRFKLWKIKSQETKKGKKKYVDAEWLNTPEDTRKGCGKCRNIDWVKSTIHLKPFMFSKKEVKDGN